jgi:hypothetical protein
VGEKVFLPPGQHPHDQARGSKPPVDWQLERVKTMLLWISEHHASFKKLREHDPQGAESELSNLEDAIQQAFNHINRLEELLRHGYSASPDAPGYRQE